MVAFTSFRHSRGIGERSQDGAYLPVFLIGSLQAARLFVFGDLIYEGTYVEDKLVCPDRGFMYFTRL
jgi:hypothetical protein